LFSILCSLTFPPCPKEPKLNGTPELKFGFSLNKLKAKIGFSSIWLVLGELNENPATNDGV